MSLAARGFGYTFSAYNPRGHMKEDTLKTVFDPAQYHAGPPGRFLPVVDFSSSDLRQLLCESIEALEQLEGYHGGVDQIFVAWRVGAIQPSEPGSLPASCLPPPADIWDAFPSPGTDEDGVIDTLPLVFDVSRTQWEKAGKPVRVEEMSKHDLQQALCQTLEALQQAQTNIEGLLELLSDWRKGLLRPHFMFAIVP